MNDPYRITLRKITLLIVLAVLAAYLPAAAQQTSSVSNGTGSLRILRSPSTTSSLAGVVGTNVPVVGEAAPDRQQVETTIAVDPRNPSILVAGAQDLRLKSSGEHRWHGYYRSTDGGASWSSSLLPGFPGDTSPQGLASPLHKSNATSDPVLAFDRMGNVYYTGLVFNISFIQPGAGTTANSTAFVAKYINDGSTYFGVTIIKGPIDADKPWIAADTTGGPNDGSVYLAFDATLSNPSIYGTIFTRSTDGGNTFAPPYFAPSDETGELPSVTVDPSGNVYVSTDAFDPVLGTALNYTQVTKITNGGTTIIQNVKVVNPAHWITSNLQGGSFRASTIPQIASDSRGIYLVFDDVSLGNANVYLTRSADGGVTWTAPSRVNQVLSGQHFFPTIAVSGGIVNLAWYDSRNSGGPGTTMTALDVYYGSSLDAGVSFSPDVRVTNVSFNPNIVKRTDLPVDLQPFMGDYIGIAATTFTAYPLWADNRFACDTFDSQYSSCVDQDAFTAAISLPDFAISTVPPTQTIAAGSSGSANITLSSVSGFQGTVTVSSSSSPMGLPINPASQNVAISPGGTASFNLTFATTPFTTLTSYTVNIVATSGPRSHSTQITVIVTSQTVGDSIIPADKPGSPTQLFPVVIPISLVLTAGILAEKVSRRRRSSQSELAQNDNKNPN